jgi:hypothetical protein
MPVAQFELYFSVALVLGCAAWIAWFSSRPRQSNDDPIITATVHELQKGWYQVVISVANRAPHGFIAVSLRRIKPRSARILAPVTSVSTDQGDFQVWSNPALDAAATIIPLNTMIEAHQGRKGVADVDSQSQISAWLFLPKKRGPRRLTLELTLSGLDECLHRYRFLPREGSKVFTHSSSARGT